MKNVLFFILFRELGLSKLKFDFYLAYATLVYRNFLKDLSSREPPGTLPRGVRFYNPKADAKLGVFAELANYSRNYFQYFLLSTDFQHHLYIQEKHIMSSPLSPSTITTPPFKEQSLASFVKIRKD